MSDLSAVARRRCRRWAHAPAIHMPLAMLTMKKESRYFLASLYVAPLGDPLGSLSSAMFEQKLHKVQSNCRFSHDVTKIQITKPLILVRFTFMMYENS